MVALMEEAGLRSKVSISHGFMFTIEMEILVSTSQ